VGAGTPPVISDAGLYPAEHRALRELFATTRALVKHWERLGAQLELDALSDGVDAGRELLAEMGPRAARHDVFSHPAAQGTGFNLGALRRVGDRFLERNQALRLSLLEVQHVATTLRWLASLAARRGDAEWEAFHRAWAARMEAREAALRDAIEVVAADPDGAIEPAFATAAGRAGTRVGQLIGTAGEAIDARLRRGAG
jgi:hypothetical protein